jgi:anti-sigma factor RsiW
MNREPACPFTVSVGAFLVGALDPTDRQELHGHLDDCEPCRSELASLAQVPGLLHRHHLSVDNRGFALGIMLGRAAPTSEAGADRHDDGPELV